MASRSKVRLEECSETSVIDAAGCEVFCLLGIFLIPWKTFLGCLNLKNHPLLWSWEKSSEASTSFLWDFYVNLPGCMGWWCFFGGELIDGWVVPKKLRQCGVYLAWIMNDHDFLLSRCLRNLWWGMNRVYSKLNWIWVFLHCDWYNYKVFMWWFTVGKCDSKNDPKKFGVNVNEYAIYPTLLLMEEIRVTTRDV